MKKKKKKGGEEEEEEGEGEEEEEEEEEGVFLWGPLTKLAFGFLRMLLIDTALKDLVDQQAALSSGEEGVFVFNDEPESENSSSTCIPGKTPCTNNKMPPPPPPPKV